jgi:tetratricopeptide (TPR) repeat protein
MRRLRLVSLAGSCILVMCVHGIAQSDFKEELNMGVQAFREVKFDEAIRHFQNATALQPQHEVAHLYLASALASEYIPGVDEPENLRLAEGAISEYQKVLDINPQSLNSLKGIAMLQLQMKKFGDAQNSYKKAIALDPKDPEDYYSIGVIDWIRTFTRSSELRRRLKKELDQPLIDAPECWDLRRSNEAGINEGIEMVAKAIELRPAYDDAMAYMNLLYRERANIQCGDQLRYDADVKAADHWVDLVLAIKKKKHAGVSSEQPASPNP